ncbi:hypothetical protein [Azonexus sp. IMCC34839]|uniref:hypothetical protein n=1 Tax=Azonexus sp. IMCC34839 TaxID=3133695 RepID=UPI00399AD610
MSEPLRVIKSIQVTDQTLRATNVLEDDSAAWSDTTTYGAGNRVHLTSSHKIYQSIQADNLGKNPESEPMWWVEVSPTNRWKLFDLSSTTQTRIGTYSFYELAPGIAVNAVALINIEGVTAVYIRLTDPDFGVVYDKSYDLGAVPSESSWYAWFFEPRSTQKQFVVRDLPSYPNATLRVEFQSGGEAYIGALVFGDMKSIGIGTRQGVRLGIQDFSRKERNEWGDTLLVQRAFARRASFNVLIDNKSLDNVFNALAAFRSTPCVWVGSDRYGSMTIFGFFNNFEINIAYARYSDVSIDIEGLT